MVASTNPATGQEEQTAFVTLNKMMLGLHEVLAGVELTHEELLAMVENAAAEASFIELANTLVENLQVGGGSG